VSTYAKEAIVDPAVLELAGRVRYETKAYDTYPAAFPGGVRIRTTGGRTIEVDFPHQLGGPENPLSGDAVRAKFTENASLALADDAVEELADAVLSLELRDDLTAVLAPLGRAALQRTAA
jgi:2-methylcitrate dehydratase PrpD